MDRTEIENNEIDDMPPDLEDFSEELGKIRVTRGSNTNNSTSQSSEIKVNVIEKEKEKVIKQPSSIPKKEEEEFSFMKKGYFKRNMNSNSNNNTKSTPTKVEDLTNIRANPEGNKKVFQDFEKEFKSNSSKMDEKSQKSLLNNIVEKKDEWMNQDLLMKISQKPNLMKSFMDPRFAEVIALLQKDPQKALAQFGHVKEFNDFIKEFSALMADHFGNLTKEKEKETPSNFDAETQTILNDPKIVPIISKLQLEGKLDIEEINKDPYISSRVNKLIEKGVFKIQRESELK